MIFQQKVSDVAKTSHNGTYSTCGFFFLISGLETAIPSRQGIAIPSQNPTFAGYFQAANLAVYYGLALFLRIATIQLL